MVIELSDLFTTTFRTTRKADQFCEYLARQLGWKHRYVAARLAIGRSLSLTDQPKELLQQEYEDMATPLRGTQLLGENSQAAGWLALILEHSELTEISKRELQNLVSRHWHRGAFLLKKDWEDSGEKMENFVSRLTELASFSGDGGKYQDLDSDNLNFVFRGEVKIPIGEVSIDTHTKKEVRFSVNGAGGSPHMAIMGGVGSGKTRTAVNMLHSIRKQSNELPFLAFDFKKDLIDPFTNTFGTTLISPPRSPVPLDVLHVFSDDDTLIKTTSARIRDSIIAVKSSKHSGVQSEALREAITSVLRNRIDGASGTLIDISKALEMEYEERGRKPDELTSTLNELTQFSLFSPEYSPAEFFSRSWLIQLPQDGSAEMRRLIINLTLDALDRWINSQPDSPRDENGVRYLRHLTMLDEAHVILSTRLPALANLVRMSRSKGGSIMLVSQSPDDFEFNQDGYLDNMGLTLAFSTQAKPGPTKRIFGNNSPLTSLQVGEAFCRIRAEATTKKILCWKKHIDL
ncbi:MAG: DndE family protein [Rhodobacteraceae bacterium]|nr:DndE family protein [Paracoccaceae bacterium]